MAKTIDKHAPASPPMVRATRFGFYRGQRIKPGMTFRLARAEDFSDRWMATVTSEAADSIDERWNERSKVRTRLNSADVLIQPGQATRGVRPAASAPTSTPPASTPAQPTGAANVLGND